MRWFCCGYFCVDYQCLVAKSVGPFFSSYFTWLILFIAVWWCCNSFPFDFCNILLPCFPPFLLDCSLTSLLWLCSFQFDVPLGLPSSVFIIMLLHMSFQYYPLLIVSDSYTETHSGYISAWPLKHLPFLTWLLDFLLIV